MSLVEDRRFPSTVEQLGIQGECFKCGGRIYGSPDSQCPKCGEVNNPQEILQVSRLPRSVETTAKAIENNFASTAELLVLTAEKLEARAADLKQKARWLLEQRGLATDLREAVTYELTAMDEVKSLALVNVGVRQDS